MEKLRGFPHRTPSPAPAPPPPPPTHPSPPPPHPAAGGRRPRRRRAPPAPRGLGPPLGSLTTPTSAPASPPPPRPDHSPRPAPLCSPIYRRHPPRLLPAALQPPPRPARLPPGAPLLQRPGARPPAHPYAPRAHVGWAARLWRGASVAKPRGPERRPVSGLLSEPGPGGLCLELHGTLQHRRAALRLWGDRTE